MIVVKRLKPEPDDKPVIKRLIELCSMARNFFDSDGFKSVTVFGQGHELSADHVCVAIGAVNLALERIEKRNHAMFPDDLKARYIENLQSVRLQLREWRDMT